MRYYSHNVYDTDHPDLCYVETKSEQEILEEYWPYWYDKMCKKFAKEHVDATYSFEDCLEDWVIINWAWLVVED